ncbi:MAG TPA: protein kinase [Gemmataceae bacterium]|jgi:serine/threonine protein kinase
MQARVVCPQPKVLKDLLDGTLSNELETQLTDHLSACGRCQQIVESFAIGTAEDVRQQLQQGRNTRSLSEGLQQTIQRLKDHVPDTEGPEENAWSETMLVRSLAPSQISGHLGRLGSYEVVETIGRGGFGVVFKAFDPSLNRFVALKVLAPHLASNAAARKRFAREARAAAAVRDEHVVAIHNVEEANGLPYLVMEYISGISLQQRLDRDGPLALEEILRIGRQTAAGLAAAHAQGLIHRDIKPANILLENNVERVKITDFGLARAADDAGLTQSGTLAGTPQYMAPEQTRGEPLDHRADLFSLGSVLYAMCTGRPPFRAESTLAVLRCINEDSPRPIRQINPSIPPWLEEIISILQAKDPDQRFSSAAEVADLMGRYLAHLQQPKTSPRPSLPSHRRQAERSRASRWLIAVLCLIGIGGFGLFALLPDGKQEEATHFYHDFRGRRIDTKSFLFTGPKARQQMTEEAEGLRITLPAPGTNPQATGLVANVRVSGDFEITTSYELLKADKPQNGSVGVQLYIVMESPTQEAIMFGRFHASDLGHIYTCARIGTNEEGKREYSPTTLPAQTQAGRLRLTRKGSRVTCFAADVGSEDFQPLAEYELGTADLTVVRIAADTGNSNSPVVVRFGDFEIQSAGASIWRTSLLYVILAICCIFLCAGGLWFWRRSKPATPATTAPAPASPPPPPRSKSLKKDIRR